MVIALLDRASNAAVRRMTRIAAVSFVAVVVAVLISPEWAEDECTPCMQVYSFTCWQNYDECMEGCTSIATIDKYGCQRRCMAVDNQCTRRAALKCGTCVPKNVATPPPRHID